MISEKDVNLELLRIASTLLVPTMQDASESIEKIFKKLKELSEYETPSQIKEAE